MNVQRKELKLAAATSESAFEKALAELVNQHIDRSFLRGVRFCERILESMAEVARKRNDLLLSGYVMALADARKMIEAHIPVDTNLEKTIP